MRIRPGQIFIAAITAILAFAPLRAAADKSLADYRTVRTAIFQPAKSSNCN